MPQILSKTQFILSWEGRNGGIVIAKTGTAKRGQSHLPVKTFMQTSADRITVTNELHEWVFLVALLKLVDHFLTQRVQVR